MTPLEFFAAGFAAGCWTATLVVEWTVVRLLKRRDREALR